MERQGVLLWPHSIFGTKGTVKASVISKPAAAINLTGRFARCHELPGVEKPLFQNISVDTGPYLTVEFMAQVILTYKELLGQQIKGEGGAIVLIDILHRCGYNSV